MRFVVVKVRITLSLILSVLSGSPPPPRFLSSVMFRSFRCWDVNVSHKPSPREGEREGERGIKSWIFFLTRF